LSGRRAIRTDDLTRNALASGGSDAFRGAHWDSGGLSTDTTPIAKLRAAYTGRLRDVGAYAYGHLYALLETDASVLFAVRDGHVGAIIVSDQTSDAGLHEVAIADGC